jgi:hypothetical protein
MFCPQCGTESAAELKFCRSCGANLKVIGKAVTLSEAIARSDAVPAKIKELISNIKISQVTEEVSRAMDKMNKEIARTSEEHRQQGQHWQERRRRRQKTPEERRERHFTKGVISLFWGSGLTVFLYFLAHALMLKLPPEVIAQTPFEIDPVVRILWLVGLLPMLSGLGHITAGLLIKRRPAQQIETGSPLRIDSATTGSFQPAARPVAYDDERTIVARREPAASVTDRTTNILDREPRIAE